MIEEKPLSKQSIVFLFYLVTIGVFIGSCLELLAGFYLAILVSAAIIVGITIYGVHKDWTFNIELVDNEKVLEKESR